MFITKESGAINGREKEGKPDKESNGKLNFERMLGLSRITHTHTHTQHNSITHTCPFQVNTRYIYIYIIDKVFQFVQQVLLHISIFLHLLVHHHHHHHHPHLSVLVPAVYSITIIMPSIHIRRDILSFSTYQTTARKCL